MIAYLKKHIGLVLYGFIGLSLCGGLAVSLQPREPHLPAYESLRAQPSDYKPGGTGCEPAEIDRLPVEDRQGRRDACAQEREEHRLVEDDLLQQTRSADAAQAIVPLAYHQSQALFYGLIFGTATLLSAIAAAKFARDAALQTKRSAEIAQRVADTDMRPWLTVLEPIIGPLTPVNMTMNDVCLSDTRYCFKSCIKVPIENSGAVPAVNVRIYADLVKRYLRLSEEEMTEYNQKYGGLRGKGSGDEMLWDVGVKKFFDEFSCDMLSSFGLPNIYTISKGCVLNYSDFTLDAVSVSKSLNPEPEMVESLVISIAYQAPGRPEVFGSQFAFDLWGASRHLERSPPSGADFATGEGLSYRQAEGHVK